MSEDNRAIEQFNEREGETATFLFSLSVKFKRAWWWFNPTSSQPFWVASFAEGKVLMKVLFLFVACFIYCGTFATAQSNIKLEIGAELPRKLVPRKIKGYIHTSTNNFEPHLRKTIASVTYDIAYDQNSRKIIYIHTMDKDFRTANGLNINSEITIAQNQYIAYSGWYVFALPTSDGWFPIIGINEVQKSLQDLKEGETKTLKVIGFAKGDY